MRTIQDDAFRGGLALARAPYEGPWDVVGEVRGQKVWFATVPPVRARSRSAKSARSRAIARPARFDGGVLSGFTERSPDFGVIAGVTLVDRRSSDLTGR